MIIPAALLAELLAERQRQDAKFGGPENDDALHPLGWIDHIDMQIDKLAQEGGGTGRGDAPLIRARLLKIGALAIAGLQSIDRTSQGAAP